MRCPKCSIKNDNSRKTCIVCGEDLYPSKNSYAKNLNILFEQNLITGIIGFIFSGIINLFIVKMYFDSNNSFIMIPFIICTFAAVLYCISLIINSIKIKIYINSHKDIEFDNSDAFLPTLPKLAVKLYKYGFFVFWFGFLLYVDYLCILHWNNSKSGFLLSLIFWAVGIFALFKSNKS